MAGVAAYAEKLLLDYVCGGATVVSPATRAVGLSIGVPSSVSGSEIGTGSGITRQLATFAAAASPAGSVSNSNAMTFGPVSSGVTISGMQIWDTSAATIGNMLWYGTLTTARTLNAGDSLVYNAGALVITLA